MESGSLEAAGAMVEDLTAIRADRDRYYYGVDALFGRHENVLQYMSTNAQSLLPVLLDGLLWHSRITIGGRRRVNYYVKHLIVDSQGRFAKALEWLTTLGDPQIVCHGVLVLVSELTWFGAAYGAFLWRKAFLMLQLAVFIISNAVLPYVVLPSSSDKPGDEDLVNRWAIFLGRTIIYIFGMSVPLYDHACKIIRSYRTRDTGKFLRCRFPKYLLTSWQSCVNLILTIVLLVMVNIEPVLWCGTHFKKDNFRIFHTDCAESDGTDEIYGLLAMIATFLYFTLLSDVLVCSMKVSAYYLVCMRMVVETGLSLATLACVTLCISAALSCLEHDSIWFNSVPSGFMTLLKMVLGMFFLDEYNRSFMNDGIIFFMVAAYMLVSVVFLINVLIAQFNSAYDAIYQDMVGYARLKRMKIIVETIPLVSKEKWNRFIDSLSFDTKLEFNDGDVGLSGGYATTEPANLHPTTEERIERIGGSTEITIPFPDVTDNDEDKDRFGRLENVIQRTLEKLLSSGQKAGKVMASSSGGSKGGSTHEASQVEEE